MSKLKLQLISDASILLAIVLLLGLLYLAYIVWNVLFYITLFILVIGVLRRLSFKVKGIALDKTEDKKLFDLAEKVSSEIGVGQINKIILTGDSNIGVTGIIDRKLLLGVATLHEISEDDLYNILFHEFAHIKGADNIIGTMLIDFNHALRDLVSLSRYSMMILSIFGLLIYIPLLIFYYIYNLIILAHSRTREFLADYIASTFVGGDKFGTTLKKYVKISEEFIYKINQVIGYYAYRGIKPDNLYGAYRDANIKFTPEMQAKIDQQKKRVHEVTSPFSTHPALEHRLEQIQNIKGKEKSLGKTKAANLISNIENKEKELTNMAYVRKKH